MAPPPGEEREPDPTPPTGGGAGLAASADAPTEVPRREDRPPPAAGQGPPRRIASYEVLDRLGRGGCGAVYRARHVALGKEVALKVLDGGAEHEIARFVEEARAMAGLAHPNIVAVHDVGEAGGRWYFTMDLAAGGTLAAEIRARAAARIPRGPAVPLERALAIIEKVARAVAYAHERGIVHRDLKPSNVLIGAGGEPLVADFGLARRLDTPRGITRTGEVLGTPAYMAPEQAAGEAVDERADVYALGAVLYEMLTGEPPLQATGVLATDLRLVIEHEPVGPRRRVPSLPRAIETIVLRALAREPGRRYPTARALADDVRRYRSGQPILARPPSLAVRAAALVRRRRVPLLVGALGATALAASGLLALEWRAERRPWVAAYESAGDLAGGGLGRWRPIAGAWRAEKGGLATSGGTPASIALDLPASGDVRVEYRARLEQHAGQAPSDLSVAILPAGAVDVEAGYFFGFGSDGNTAAKLLRRGRRIVVAEGEGTRIVRGRVHEVLAERAGGALRLAVDGRTLLECRELAPLGLGDGVRIALYTWDGEARFERVRVSTRLPPEKARGLDTAERLLERGEPRAAALLYAEAAAAPGLAAAEREEIEVRRGFAELAAAEAEPAPGGAERAAALGRAEEALGKVAARGGVGEPVVRAALGLAEAALERGDVAGGLARVQAVIAARAGALGRDGARDVLARAEARLERRGDLVARIAVLRATRDAFGGEPWLAVDLAIAEAESLLELGRTAEAAAVLRGALAAHGESRFHRAALELGLAHALWRGGALAEARAAAARAEAAGDDGFWRLEAAITAAQIALEDEDATAARAATGRARAMSSARGGAEAAALDAIEARIDLALAKDAAARAAAVERLEALAGASASDGDPEARGWGAQAALCAAAARASEGDTAGAFERLASLAPLLAEPPSPNGAAALLAAGLVAMRMGGRDAAAPALERVVASSARFPHLRAIAAELLGRGAVEGGEGDSARDLTIAALARGTAAAARGDRAGARRLLEAAAGRPGGPAWARALARSFLEGELGSHGR